MAGGCTWQPTGFVTDKKAWAQIADDFERKRAALPHGNLFAVLDTLASKTEREALIFLYAYMPIGDAVDYDGQFYLRNVRAALRARQEMSWGRDIPEDVFRHFVLPVRVNNENLDESRLVFYDQLRERLAGMSLYQAVLEVNHWCHEQVVYAPSDARTSSPLASVRSAVGRCGEESVFTVAALRAAGIPARQVYTPRWAHTDDNHAWVEAWVDGQWHFLGACEPEPVLDMAWFNAPAYRSMLMHTKAFGRYNGPEETIATTDCFTEINVTGNYAPTARATVTVIDAQGQPAPGARVEWKLYNYAEFYTIAHSVADADGKAFFTAGRGDMLVWASHNGRFGFSRLSFGHDASHHITLDKQPGDPIQLPLDIVPPPDGAIPSRATAEQTSENAIRLRREDALRNQYVSTFYTTEEARSLARELRLDEARTARLMTASRGNRAEIEAFLRQAAPAERPTALALLEAISTKDLRDTPASVLTDHLRHTPGPGPGDSFISFVLNPRIADELLTPYKTFFRDSLPQALQEDARRDPQALADWLNRSVAIAGGLNPQQIPISPAGVWKARVADVHSRNICFVAMARSLGIPARIEPVAGKVQYFREGRWVDTAFEATAADLSPRGAVTADYAPIPSLDDPKYYTHFTIARIRDDGTLQTLNFESGGPGDMGRGDAWSLLLRRPLPLDEGHYLLTTGTRMAKGNVLAQLSSFTVSEGETTGIDLLMRANDDDVQVIGSIDAEAPYRPVDANETSTILQTTGRGYFILAILGVHQEPTHHALRDIASLSQGFEQWGRPMLLLFPSEDDWQSFAPLEYGALPSTVAYGIDDNRRIASMLAAAMHLSDTRTLPLVVIADTFGRVVFLSQGYTIGLGEQILQTIGKL
jgi:transglutaminase-like putative cysteine protease